MSRFVILLSTHRCGTNYFRSLLCKTGFFDDCGEILNSTSWKGISSLTEYELLFEENPRLRFNYHFFKIRHFQEYPTRMVPLSENVVDTFQAYMDYVEKHSRGEKRRILDIKYAVVHNLNLAWHRSVAAPYLFEIAKRFEIPIIHLQRENLINSALSLRIAEANNKHCFGREDADFAFGRTRIDVAELLKDVRARSLEREAFRAFVFQYQSKLELSYEEVTDPVMLDERARPALEGFFDIELPANLDSHLIKTPRSYPELIENYDEVIDAIRNTEFSQYVNAY